MAESAGSPSPCPRCASRWRQTLWNLALLAAFAFLLWTLHGALLQAAGGFLILQDPPARVDLIVVHGGESERIAYGAELMRRGLAPRMVVFLEPAYERKFFGFTGGEMIAEMRKDLEQMGVSPASVDLRGGVTSSWEEVQSVRRLLVPKVGGFELPVSAPPAGEEAAPESAVPVATVLVVSNPFHLRRLSLCYARVFEQGSPRFRFTPVPWERLRIRREDWWTREEELVLVQSEYVKILYYWVHYL